MLLDRRINLPSGVRVRVRLPHSSDRAGVVALHDRLGLSAGTELYDQRLLHFDPRGRTVLCATAWHGVTEVLVAYGAIERNATAPHLLVCDDDLAPGLRAHLHEVLVEATADRRAA